MNSLKFQNLCRAVQQYNHERKSNRIYQKKCFMINYSYDQFCEEAGYPLSWAKADKFYGLHMYQITPSLILISEDDIEMFGIS